MIPDGTYNFIGTVVSALREPGVKREDVIAFRKIVEAVQGGNVSSELAATEIEQISHSFGQIWEWMTDNGVAIGLLLTVLTLFVTLYLGALSDQSSMQAHSDAQQQLMMQQRIYAVLQERHGPVPPLVGLQPPKQPKKEPARVQTPRPDGPSREQRRRLKQIARKHQSPS